MNNKLPWRIEFDMHGGYDCMSSSYDIIDVEGNHLFEIDTQIDGLDGEDVESVIKKRKLAEFIVKSVNDTLGDLK